MYCWSKKISQNYAFEISGFHLIRKFSDGLTLFDVHLNWDWFKGDHNPQINYLLIILNFKVLEINLYNVNHADVAE